MLLLILQHFNPGGILIDVTNPGLCHHTILRLPVLLLLPGKQPCAFLFRPLPTASTMPSTPACDLHVNPLPHSDVIPTGALLLPGSHIELVDDR